MRGSTTSSSVSLRSIWLVPLFLLLLLMGAGHLAAKQVRVTLSEGTNMALALSPDGAQMVIDLQGTLWTLPANGGVATAITDPLNDARQPAWSPDGSRIALQSYREGNWHLEVTIKNGVVYRLQQLLERPE